MSMQKKPEEMAIVVVAADPANTKTVSSYLKTIGYAGVKHMDNGIEAMQSLVENPCDLIIVDANVRFLPGWMLVKELKISEKVRNMPVILCGGGEPPASKEELQRYGVLDFFKMPGTASSFHFMLQSTVATASPSSGYHKAADSITIMITFDEAVTLAIGSAEATLNSGGTATYVSGSGTAALAFTYEILATENSGDLDLSATNALTLTGGGTLRDLAGNNATLTVPIGVTSGSLASNANLLVDTTAPSAFSVSSPVDTVTINDNTPTISWSDPTDADFYSLKVDMDAGCASPDQQHLAQAWATSKTLTTLADGTYYLCITAADSAGNNTNAVMTSFTVNTGTWSAITTTGAPAIRRGATAIYDTVNDQTLVWGGFDGTNYLATGAQFDGSTWSNGFLNSSAPAGRYEHTAVWTGSKMIVWGGVTAASTETDTGGVYDPSSGWTDTVTDAVASARTRHSAVWDNQNSKMIIWGGFEDTADDVVNTGAAYDAVGDSWVAIDVLDGDLPSARQGHTAVWTGNTGNGSTNYRMIVWGGRASGGSALNTGAIYDPSGGGGSDYWAALPTLNAPSARWGHTAIWTGSKLIIWGGYDGTNYKDDGAIYDPALNTWTSITNAGGPPERANHTAVWTGSKMMIWGGESGVELSSGAVFDPAGTWTVEDTNASGAPAARTGAVSVWDSISSKVLIWGGYDATYMQSGAVYTLP